MAPPSVARLKEAIHALLRQSRNRKRRVDATCRTRDERAIHHEQIRVAEDLTEVVANSADDSASEWMCAEQRIYRAGQGSAVCLVQLIIGSRDGRSIFHGILRGAWPEQIGGLC